MLSSSSNQPQTGLTPYRFVIVVIYFLLNFANAIHWVTYASCASTFGEFYSLNNFQVDLLSMIFMSLYPIGCVPQAYITDNISTSLGLRIPAILTILGSFIKIFLNSHLFFAYLGQILVASFQPAILNSPAKIASLWFDQESRVLITSICCSSNTIGVLFGYLIHGFVVNADITDASTYHTQFAKYMVVEFIITTVLCLPMLLLIKEKPDIPPSLSQKEYKSPPLKESIVLLFKNKEFVKLLISTTCIVGYVNIIGTIVNSYLTLYNISDDATTYTAAISNLFGIISSVVVSAIVDKQKQYKKMLMILNIAACVFMLLLTIILEYAGEGAAIVAGFGYTLVISSIVPIYTTAMDYVCELTYPVGESYSEGLIMSANQIMGIIGILICDTFMEYIPNAKYLSNAFGLLLFIISLISIAYIDEVLKRNLKDKGSEISNELTSSINENNDTET